MPCVCANATMPSSPPNVYTPWAGWMFDQIASKSVPSESYSRATVAAYSGSFASCADRTAAPTMRPVVAATSFSGGAGNVHPHPPVAAPQVPPDGHGPPHAGADVSHSTSVLVVVLVVTTVVVVTPASSRQTPHVPPAPSLL